MRGYLFRMNQVGETDGIWVKRDFRVEYGHKTYWRNNISFGTNSVENPRILFSHLILNLPQVLDPPMSDTTGGRR